MANGSYRRFWRSGSGCLPAGHGLKLNLEKTEVLHIGHQREELDIKLEGEKLTQRDSFVYLGGAVCGDGKTEREVRRRVQAGANAWRAVEGVMADRRISNWLKGKVMSTCVTPACLYGTETLALTELQQHRLQVCENNWVRKIARVTRADRRRMVELTGVQRSLTERLVRSRLQWAGHVERMADDRLPKRAADLREPGRRRQGRPRLRWEDCVKRDVKKAGEGGDWKKTGYRGGWNRLADEAVKKLQAAPHPWQREKKRKRENLQFDMYQRYDKYQTDEAATNSERRRMRLRTRGVDNALIQFETLHIHYLGRYKFTRTTTHLHVHNINASSNTFIAGNCSTQLNQFNVKPLYYDSTSHDRTVIRKFTLWM